MRKVFLLSLILCLSTINKSDAQITPCNLVGASVYLDYSSSPSMMNASVNGVSMYQYLWSNGAVGNQTAIYPGWCVVITDLMNGCDTIICENCIADTTTVCPCPMIYMPVCGCDGVMYPNSCVAICAGVGWAPAVPTGMPGGFQPCAQPTCIDSSLINLTVLCLAVWDPVCGCDSVTYQNSCVAENWHGVTSWTQGACNIPQPCVVDINNGATNISICDGDTAILEANTGFTSYFWSTNDTSRIIEVLTSGIYFVVATDTLLGCVDIDSIEITVYQTQSLNPMTNPNPPNVCLGDSVVIEVTTGFLNYYWNTGNSNHQDEDRVVIFPIQDFIYIVEALDSNGCEEREEIQVFVDSCSTDMYSEIFSKIRIYPNPAKEKIFIELPENEVFDILIFDIEGKLVSHQKEKRGNLEILETQLSKGSYIIKILNEKGTINRKVIFK